MHATLTIFTAEDLLKCLWLSIFNHLPTFQVTENSEITETLGQSELPNRRNSETPNVYET